MEYERKEWIERADKWEEFYTSIGAIVKRIDPYTVRFEYGTSEVFDSYSILPPMRESLP